MCDSKIRLLKDTFNIIHPSTDQGLKVSDKKNVTRGGRSEKSQKSLSIILMTP
jgi:hypothetical protein